LGHPPGTHSKKSFYIELVPGEAMPTGWEELHAAFAKGNNSRVLVPDHAIWSGRFFSPRQQQWITDEGIIDIRFDEAGAVVEKHLVYLSKSPDDLCWRIVGCDYTITGTIGCSGWQALLPWS
jgi:hypothetical protein